MSLGTLVSVIMGKFHRRKLLVYAFAIVCVEIRYYRTKNAYRNTAMMMGTDIGRLNTKSVLSLPMRLKPHHLGIGDFRFNSQSDVVAGCTTRRSLAVS